MLRGTLLFFICFFATTQCIFPQITVQDSLLQELRQYPTQDSLRVKLLLNTTASLTYTNPKAAIPHVQEAINITEKIRWKKGEGLANVAKGNLYYVMADNLNALAAYQKALAISKSLKNVEMEASVLSNLGNIHADLKEYDQAISKYSLLLNQSKKLENKSNQIKALTNIAIIYNDTGRQTDGIAYLEKALLLAKEEKNAFFEAAITNNLGLAYKGLREYEKSLEYYRKSIEIAIKIDNNYIEASALNSIGKVSVLLGDYEQAGIHGKQALALSQKIGTIEWEADSWKVLSTVYEHEGNANAALDAYKNYIIFRDSVIGEEKKADIARKEMQYELEQQEEASQLALEKQTRAKNTYFFSGITIIIAAVLAYFLYKRKRDRLERNSIEEFKAKVTETELKALRSQMNPHFIFNALNSISDYMEKHNVEQANDYLMKFAKLTRAILENSEKKWISLQEDLELMELYIEIENLRLQNKLHYQIEVDEVIDVENTMVPPLMLQPFIENSIWHGIAPKKGQGNLVVQIIKDDDMICCAIDDDGVGRKKSGSTPQKNDSLGIKITKNRLEILNQFRKLKGSIKMLDKVEGLRVELKLPLELRF